ncbi:heavy metal transporter, partial [Streptomyces sp. NPDC023723]
GPVVVSARPAGPVAVPGGADGRRGWQLAHWAVAHASALHIERVAYEGREWRAGTVGGGWRAVGSAAGARGAERDGGSVRIVTVR